MGNALRRLIMASVACWLVTIGLAVWRAMAPLTGRWADGVTVLAAAAAITFTLLAGQRFNRPVRDPVRVLLDALLADEADPLGAPSAGLPDAPAGRAEAA